jgi:hypothetical protein
MIMLLAKNNLKNGAKKISIFKNGMDDFHGRDTCFPRSLVESPIFFSNEEIKIPIPIKWVIMIIYCYDLPLHESAKWCNL